MALLMPRHTRSSASGKVEVWDLTARRERDEMKSIPKSRWIVSTMAVFYMSGAASAVFAGGPIAGGSAQAAAVCYVFNSGTTTVPLGGYGVVPQIGSGTLKL
jgi:hypothetical protein